MNKYQLQRKLRERYNRDSWKEVLLEMFPEANMFAQDRPTVFTREEQRNLASHIAQFGEVELGHDKLIFLEVELKPDSVQLTRNRVGLRKLVDNEVVAGLTDGALISYYQPETDEWRITFYSERYGWDEDGNTIKEETHPKRYTYVVGPSESCKTAAGQLVKVIETGRGNTLENVLESFSVQKVSKEFFKEYKEQYDKFVGYLTGKIWAKSGVKEVGDRISQFQFFFKATTDHEKEARDFVKKLLGRIVFLYFVQKKQWLGASSTEFKDGKSDFIYDLFKQVPEGKKDQFYSQWLTKLFFDTLNRDDSHAFTMPDESTVYIPFLNGGLFEKDDTDKNTEALPLPGTLFSNPEDTESPNTRGFLDFLSAYNFTIHEDSPGDHTIAVDPEMLGHIFENLLEDNKDKGAYYTPKPIVHYMCQESLIEYLLTELTAEGTEDAEKEELRGHFEDLIKKQEAGELVGFTEAILKSLKEVKVCDPAIGSGAFPMGILQEIYQAVETLHHLSPDNVRAIWELPDDDWHPAEVKKQIIQHSIYGVDIEKGAVDIARLRFWLSLIVDEEEPTALPNLDYKIVVGDSLVSKLVLNGEEKVVEINWDIKHDVESLRLHVQNLKASLNSIVAKQKEFFEADNDAKNELREEIKHLKIDAFIHQLRYDREFYNRTVLPKGGGMPTSSDREHNLNREIQLKEYTNLIEELQNVKSHPESEFQHFEWKLDFPEIMNPTLNEGSTGFDVIIANPPYGITVVDEYRIITEEKLGKVPDYEIYYLFIQLLHQLVNDKTVCTYIIPNSVIFNVFAAKYRKQLLNEWDIIELLDCTNIEIFNATVRNIILSLRKDSEATGIGYRRTKNVESFVELINKKREKISKENLLKFNQNWGLALKLDKSVIQVINKIKNGGRPLNKYFEVSQGYIPYRRRDLVKQFGEEKGNSIVDNREWHSNQKVNDDYKQEIRGRGLNKYGYEKAGSYVFYGEHLATYINPKFFNQRRLLIREITNPTIIGCIVEEELVNDPQIISVIPNSKKEISINTLWGFMNSKLATFYHFNASPKATKGAFPKILVTDIKKFPLPNNLDELDDRMNMIVDQILTQKEANPDADTTALEQQIDTLVYKLYNLTWKEVQVVDPEFALSEEEYEGVEVENEKA